MPKVAPSNFDQGFNQDQARSKAVNHQVAGDHITILQRNPPDLGACRRFVASAFFSWPGRNRGKLVFGLRLADAAI